MILARGTGRTKWLAGEEHLAILRRRRDVELRSASGVFPIKPSKLIISSVIDGLPVRLASALQPYRASRRPPRSRPLASVPWRARERPRYRPATPPPRTRPKDIIADVV